MEFYLIFRLPFLSIHCSLYMHTINIMVLNCCKLAARMTFFVTKNDIFLQGAIFAIFKGQFKLLILIFIVIKLYLN